MTSDFSTKHTFKLERKTYLFIYKRLLVSLSAVYQLRTYVISSSEKMNLNQVRLNI